MEDGEQKTFLPADISTMRTELQSATPHEQEVITDTAQKIAALLLERFGTYISDEKRDRIAEIANRVLVVDEDIMRQYKRNRVENPIKRFFTNLRLDRESKIDAVQFGLYDEDYNTMFLLSPRDTDSAIDKMPELISYFKKGGADAADSRRQAVEYLTTSTLAHELLHVIGREEAPELFKELGAEYYQRDILNILYPDQRTLNGLIVNTDARIYEAAENKFGKEIMLKTFFDDGTRTSGPQLEIMFACDSAVTRQGGLLKK